MNVRTLRVTRLLFLLLIFAGQVLAQDPPTGFASVTVSGQWNEAVGLTFSEDGTAMFVWERGGRVWVVINDQKQLLIDISDEVGAWHDLGLLGFALHPHFDENGYLYLLYTVDRHHLINHGTPAYSPTTNNYFSATINRLTRYTATKTGSGYTVNPASRTILIGATKSTGIPQLSETHGPGSLVFGADHTLLVSVGDGAGPTHDAGSQSTSYYAQGLADGIITPIENVGSFRCQLLDSHNGKILRINPETGEGIPSNPFYDASKPFSPISRVYALGLRQPFKMVRKPGTGSHNPADGDPGIFYEGDVGFVTWEEVNVIDKPGLNFGWPVFEGFGTSSSAPFLTPNLTAPNPLYQVNGCNQQYFYFQDLIKQATASGQVSFPNPCNPAQSIPSSIKTFIHTRPIIDWNQDNPISRTGIFNGETAGIINIGAPGSPVAGPQFSGSASVGGVFYTGSDFPPEYQNTYFFGDYTGGWIRNLTVNATDKPVEVKNFIDNGAIVVGMYTHPTQEGLYYINFPSEIKKIYYSSNRPPVAVASVDKKYGPSPLAIQFTGGNSIDPESQPLTYEWNFGDGSPLSTVDNPTHSFTAPPGEPTKYTVTLKVTDVQSVTNQITLDISVNNTPPQVNITSPIDNALYPLTEETTYPLHATVTDQEHSTNQLSYKWQTILHHEHHEHPSPPDSSPQSTTTISPLGCDGETYFYQIILTVTDAAGASTTDEVRLYPDCDNVKFTPLISWINPAPIVSGTALSATQLNAIASYNGSPVAGTFTYTPALGTVLGVGNAQPLAVSFAPSDTSLYNHPGPKTVFINVTPTVFYRALNLNGPALPIDGHNWEASTGAPNFTYTTNRGVFENQSVALVPATDANRATMIRSSIWGENVTLTVGAVPAGAYQVWVYVWEDNAPTTFSISLEGTVVQAFYNSGAAGTWGKLGPFQATINDGAINISAAGGHPLLSGLEIWRVGAPGGNQPPVVANEIANQATAAGTAFNFSFPSNTFSDPDPGTVLTYSATLTSGSALPGWLTFNAGTRSFSGTPGSGDVGTLNVRVTASDGAGGSVNDEFALVVNAAGGPAVFYRALNMNGPALSIDGHNWEASATAQNFTYTTDRGLFANQAVTLIPATDADRATMIRSSIWGKNVSLAVGSVPAGSYQVWVYVWEDNAATIYSISLEGTVVQSNYNSGGTGVWNKLGPFPVTINDGTINVSGTGGDVVFSGLEIWGIGTPGGNQPPVVANPIANQTTTTGTAFNFAFPSNTFSDPDAGTVLTYSASLSSGSALPTWLTFNGATRSFSGTSGSGDVGTLNVRVTASDGAGGSVNDEFTLAVNVAGGQAVFYRALNLNGPALLIDGHNWEASASAANFTYTTNRGLFANQAITLIPSTDANRATMIRSSIWGENLTLTVGSVPAGTYQVWVYVWEDNIAQTFSMSLEGTVVQANYNSGGPGIWNKLGPFQATINDGAINISATGPGYAQPSGLEIWSVGASGGNQPPIVANAIPNQTTTVGTAFNFTFPSNTFSDPDAGTVLTYSASLSSGSALPGWLNFNGATRTFSGTSGSGDIGTLNVRVTASDGAGGSVNDEFTLAVNAAGGSEFFYRAINLNGPALPIDGHNWEASVGAANFTYTTDRGLFANQAITLIPSTDADRATMIRSSVWGKNVSLAVGSVPAGSYKVWVYVWEDNGATNYSISLEGAVVQANYNSGGAGIWSKLGPFQATINDGTINVSGTGGDVVFSGIEIWGIGAPGGNNPPIVANPIANQTTIAGTAFNFTFPSNTFSDPDAGTVLTYSATLASGSALPGWLTFNGTTRSFSGTSGSGDIGTLNIRVTVSDGAGGSVNDEFTLAVNAAGGSEFFYRAINLNGPALPIDGHNWEASVGAANFTYTTDRGLFANQAVNLIPSTDADRASMIRSSVWGKNVALTVSSVPAGAYQVWVYVWEDNGATTYSISLEGAVVQANYNSGGAGIWSKLGPFPATINDGTINVSGTGGDVVFSGIEIWGVDQSGGRLAFVTAAETQGEGQDHEGLRLEAHPNPFSKEVNIVFTAIESSPTLLAMYDVRGVRVRVLFEGNLLAGKSEELKVESADMSDGVYILRLVNGTHVKHFKVAIAR